MRSRWPRERGFSLVEVTVVVGLVGILMAFVWGSVAAVAVVQRDTIVESEVVGLASRTLDGVANSLTQADLVTRCGSLDANGTICEFVQVNFMADMSREQGVFTPAGAWQQDWRVRAEWIEDTGQPFPSPWDETRYNVDLNGDGDASDTAVRLGHLELRYYDGATEIPALRRSIASGSVRIVRDAFDGSAAAPVRIFSRPPTVHPTTGVDTTRLDTAAIGFDENGVDYDRGVQLNLRVVHNPVPNAQGRPETIVVNARRLLVPR